MLGLFADAFALTASPRLQQVCEETVAWLVREMRAPEGGFYAALDADSEHEEGKFYVWTPDQVKQVLSPEEFAVVAPHYGLDQAPNFEDKHWNFRLAQPLAAGQEGVLAEAKAKLLDVRAKRVRPGRDDKLLVSWNALIIKGLARAARVFSRPDWTQLAQQAVDFIQAQMWQEQRLLASYKDGQARLNAYLDDYAFLLDALLDLMQTEFRPQDLAFAQALADCLLSQFEDPEQGGFFFTSHDHEQLIHRPKPGPDQATPSGNGVAVFALQRLGHLLGEARYLESAERALTLFYPSISGQPAAYASLLIGLKECLNPPDIVVIRGPRAGIATWRKALASTFFPNALVLSLSNEVTELPAPLAKPESADVNAWVCNGVNCLPVVSTLTELISLCKVPRGD